MTSRDPRTARMKNLLGRLAASTAVALFVVALVTLTFPGVSHASFFYSIPKQQDQLTVKEDGAVTLVRYFEFKVEPGSTDNGTEIWAGLPTSSTRVSSVVDENGKGVKFQTRSSGGEYTVALTGFTIKPGTSKGFTVTATIPNFMYQDIRNAEYVTLQYTPGWWTSPVAVQDVAIILPQKVEKSEIKTGTQLWNGIAQTSSGAYVVTWQFKDLKAGEKVIIAIGIPRKYVSQSGQAKPAPGNPPSEWAPSQRTGLSTVARLAIAGAVLVLIVIAVAVVRARRGEYTTPLISMEGVGVNETLSPVEVSVLLRQPPEKALALLLFSMVKKGVLRVYSKEPLRVAVDSESDISEAERLFIYAIDRASGEIRAPDLVPCFKFLTTSVNEKMRPYCRKDTEAHYVDVIRQAWDEVTAAGTPELKLSAIEKNLLWLLQDEKRMKDAGDLFPKDKTVESLPDWWTLGFMWSRPFDYSYNMWPEAIYEYYWGICGGLLGDQEKESMRKIDEEVWTPARAPSREPFWRSWGGGGRSSYQGGFTPPSCACACACVSCACACACAGGGGCT